MIVSRRGSSGAIVAVTTSVISAGAFWEKGERGGEVGGEGSSVGWGIVGALIIERLPIL